MGRRYYVMNDAAGYRERGVASWYGTKFHGLSTSSGEPYDMYAMTAAHKTLPLPSYVRVTHVDNGRSVVVRVNDRGPFIGDRIIDLSYAAAVRLGMHLDGTALVDVELIEPGGAPGRVVTAAVPEPVPAGNAEPVARAEPAAAAIWLQVGAFSDAQNAARLQARLASAGIREVVTSAQRRGANTVHRVRVGPLSAADEAERMLERVRALGFGDAHFAAD
jgi:rare lipoprotein A